MYDEMLPYREQFAWAGPVCRGPVAHSLGVLARTTGDVTLAAEHFAEADAINTRMKAAFFQVRTWVEWADLLLAGGDVDGRLRAEEMPRSLRQMITSGWIPRLLSSVTECWVGFVFCSPDGPRYGTSVTWT